MLQNVMDILLATLELPNLMSGGFIPIRYAMVNGSLCTVVNWAGEITQANVMNNISDWSLQEHSSLQIHIPTYT